MQYLDFRAKLKELIYLNPQQDKESQERKKKLLEEIRTFKN
jgi:hypothetical protein